MKRLVSLLVTAVILAGLLAFGPARAATSNVPVAIPGVMLVPIHLDGQFTATTAAAATFKLPFPAVVLGVSASARASGGTSPTLTVDVNDDGTTILSSDITVTAGSVAEGTLASTTAATIADESVITIDLTIGGTSPTWDDIDVLITIYRN